VGGLTGGGGELLPAAARAAQIEVGWLQQPVAGASDAAAERERLARVHAVGEALAPLMQVPPRSRGRRALAEAIGRQLGVGVPQVYRLEARLRHGGHLALARLGRRADRGQRRHVVSEAWEQWCTAAGGEPLALTERLRIVVRQAWLAGATGARQCWIKASAELARQLAGEGLAQAALVGLLHLPCPRDWVEAEGQHYRVAGRARRDAKRTYDQHVTPVRRSAVGLAPGDVVCGDVSPLDIPVARPDGSTAYARMIVWHDVATNWLQADLWLCDKGTGIRREHVAASFARLCEEAPFGAPRRLYLDNGSEYRWDDMLIAWQELSELTCHQLAVDLASLLPEAGRVIRSIPYHPRGKRVEGQFGNLRHWLAWSLQYVGGNRLAKKCANLGRAPTVAPYDAVCDWFRRELADYHATPQPGAEHMGGMSPQQRIDWHLSAGWRPAHVDRMALMLAFAEREVRTVTRGAVSWGGREYHADELMHVEGRVLCARPRVCAPDADYLFVFDRARRSERAGELICIATPSPIYGLLEPAGAKEAGRRRAAFRLLTGARHEAAGGALDEAGLAGFRAEILGLDATLERAQAAATEITLSPEAQALVARRAQYGEEMRQMLARRDAARQAESLHRLALETEDEAAARALGY
jgi:hypothetical protein